MPDRLQRAALFPMRGGVGTGKFILLPMQRCKGAAVYDSALLPGAPPRHNEVS
jgi:hypothetical protein